MKNIRQTQRETKNYLRANHKTKYPIERKPIQKEVVYVAPDSCILIDIEKIRTKRLAYKKDPDYFKSLNSILKVSKEKKNGKFGHGLVVLMLLPATKEELSDYHGKFHETMKNIIDNHTLVVEINKDFLPDFEKLEKKLVKEYIEKGIFLPDQAMDARYVAEASIFNLQTISRDNDVIRKENGRLEKLKAINRRVLGGDFDGFQASPIKSSTFIGKIKKNMAFPTPERFEILSKENIITIKELSNKNMQRNKFDKPKNRV